MSSTLPTELSLSEVIEESNLIVEVVFIATSQEEVPIKGSAGQSTSAPPFIKKTNVFDVKSILKNAGEIKVPAQLIIPDQQWRSALSKHKEKYAGGPKKLFPVIEYKTQVKSIKQATLLFLHQFQNTFELTAKNSFEDDATKEKISMLINNE